MPSNKYINYRSISFNLHDEEPSANLKTKAQNNTNLIVTEY